MNFSCMQSMDDLEPFAIVVELIRSTLNYSEKRGGGANADLIIQEATIHMIRVPLYAVVMLASLVGNVLVIVTICLDRLMMSKATNYFMLNLALCDLAILVSCMWVEVVNSLQVNILLSELFCKINSFVQVASLAASVLTLVAISCERFLVVMYPLEASTRLSTGKSLACIVAIWTLSSLIGVPSYLFRTYTEKVWADYVERQCDDMGWPVSLAKNEHDDCLQVTRPGKHIYHTAIILFLFFLPIVVMTITYSIMIDKLWRVEATSERDQRTGGLDKKKHVIRMMMLIFVLFVACWTPLETMLLYMEYSREFPVWWSQVEWIAYFLAYTNTAINPIVYVGLSQNFRQAFGRRFSTQPRLRGRSNINLSVVASQIITASRYQQGRLKHIQRTMVK